MKEWRRWATELASDLDVEAGQLDHELVLEMAREATRAVAQPAAPLGAYLAGIVVGRGRSPDEAIRRVSERAQSWTGIDWRD